MAIGRSVTILEGRKERWQEGEQAGRAKAGRGGHREEEQGVGRDIRFERVEPCQIIT